MLQHLLGIPFSLLVVLLNLPFFYLGYRRLGRGIAAAATYAIVVVAVCSSFFSRMAPVSIDPLLATIYGGILIGIGVGIVIRCGGRRTARKSWPSSWTTIPPFLSANWSSS